MKAAFFSSEVFPFAKTGGLADVAGALPLALGKLGVEVKVFMPLYKGITPQSCNNNFGASSLAENVEVIFIKNDPYYLRDHLYNTPQGDYPDNLERFSFFCRKSLEALKELDFKPDIIHCNDWQSALLPSYLKERKASDGFFKNARSLLTIHNLAFQGHFAFDKFKDLGLSAEVKEDLAIYGKLNFLKGGIITADRVNTVSPSYAQEVQTKEFGCGLDHVLRTYSHKMSGILNAIDYAVWDPAKDTSLPFPYSADSLNKKQGNKVAFQKELGLRTDPKAFLLGMVSRLTDQKGVDILSQVLPKILKRHQVVILGTGDPQYHVILQGLAEKYPQNLSLHIAFDETLAHKIYACSDVFLLPSRFEPCGLSQMISFKYATLPLVHATGGLKDTVVDYFRDKKNGCGFSFSVYSGRALLDTVAKAHSLFVKTRDWEVLQRRVAGLNFSWERAAREYLKLYEQMQQA